MFKVSRALLSVYDKTGIIELGHRLSESGVEIISTGGTAKALREAGIDVVDVSQITGFPEIMEGRVKTLHPLIHGGLLGKLDDDLHLKAMEEHGITSIDLVVINLYPFEDTVARPDAEHDDIIEQIDIGGPAMIRASAKNYLHTAVVTDPGQYPQVITELRSNDMTLTPETRLHLAKEAFARTALYDTAIAEYLLGRLEGNEFADRTETASATPLSLDLQHVQTLRYGENPHQKAALYGTFQSIFTKLHGKELSYNNILDIDAASKLALEFEEPTVVIVKHSNPCGVGSSPTRLLDAWHKAFATDRKSPFGGIIAVNRKLDADTAHAIDEIFTEVIIAPAYDEEAFELLTKKKNRRLLTVDYAVLQQSLAEEQVRSVAGGVLVQDYDGKLYEETDLKVVTKRDPSDEEMAALQFAWRVAKHVKSNAIVYAASDRTLGIGAGQMSRVDSARIAAHKAEIAGIDLKGCAVASDAFFPFADGLMEAVEAGATSVIQPGGSIRDQEVIDAADEHGIAMVMTGMRHFRH